MEYDRVMEGGGARGKGSRGVRGQALHLTFHPIISRLLENFLSRVPDGQASAY